MVKMNNKKNNATTNDAGNCDNKKSILEIATEKSERIMNGVAYWASFYRENPQRFVKDYLNISLKLFQKILLYAMAHNYYFLYIAARGQGKTWLIALYIVCQCILYPRTKICIAASTKIQANEVLSKIEDDFMKNYGWGSDNLCREIEYHQVGVNKAVIKFKNGSWAKVVTSTDSARGNRATTLVVDEFRMVDLNTINTVLRKFLSAPRHPGYLDNPKYEHLYERNKEVYMSSAWMVNHWSYEKAKTYTANMLSDGKKYFICSLPYQISIKEGLLSREQVEDEMSENDFDDMKFTMEMEALFYGTGDGAFFSLDDISKRRKLKYPVYPSYITGASKTFKMPELEPNERRILSVDVALMATKKTKNDASAIIINRAMPTNNDSYVANIVYTENVEGATTEDLALLVRKLFDDYKCTDLVIDTLGVGLGVYDALIRDMVDPETGKLYPALSCCNDKSMAERCKVFGAPEVIWSIKGNAAFNNEICLLLRSGFQNNRINLLVPDDVAKDLLGDKLKTYSKLSAKEQLLYEMPYINTSLLVNELVRLQYEVKNGNVKVKELTGMRKDRYSSLAYNYWVQCQLERDVLQKKGIRMTAKDFAVKIGRYNKRPNMY